jgi:hypothetical protein
MSIIDSLLTPKEPKAPKTSAKAKTPRKPTTKHSTNTSSILSNIFGRALKSKALNIAVASTGFAMFALSTLTLLGYRTPLTPLGFLGLAILASTSVVVGFAGMFMLLSGTIGGLFRGVRR